MYDYIAGSVFALMTMNAGDCITCSSTGWDTPTGSPTYTVDTDVQNTFSVINYDGFFDSYIMLRPKRTMLSIDAAIYPYYFTNLYEKESDVGSDFTLTSSGVQVSFNGQIQCYVSLTIPTVTNFPTSANVGYQWALAISAAGFIGTSGAYAEYNGSSTPGLFFNQSRFSVSTSRTFTVTSGQEFQMYLWNIAPTGYVFNFNGNDTYGYLLCGRVKTTSKFYQNDGNPIAYGVGFPTSTPSINSGTDLTNAFIGPSLSPTTNTPSISRNGFGNVIVSTTKYYIVCMHLGGAILSFSDGPTNLYSLGFWLNLGATSSTSRYNFIQTVYSVYTTTCTIQLLYAGTYSWQGSQNTGKNLNFAAQAESFYLISDAPLDISFSPTAAPTTSKPSASPTTSKPSASPTTSKPSASPTTSKPSMTPSRTPSRAPLPRCSGSRPNNTVV